MKLAFVGQPAVGKDAVSEYIEQKYKLIHVSSGDIVRDYITKNNLGGLERENVHKIANQMRSEKGGDVLVKIALDKAEDNIIISGLRAIDEVETFKKLGGIIIAVTAPLEKRYEWAKMRKRIGDDVSFEDFVKIENDERKSTDRNGQNVDQVISMADIEIVNDGTLEDLFKKSDEALFAR